MFGNQQRVGVGWRGGGVVCVCIRIFYSVARHISI